MPFGEEAFIGVGNRAVGHGYTYGDSTRQKFTGYERDEETNLDFAQVRMYSSQLGRFTSVDPENYGASEDDPQSWNGYGYARSNPILCSDPEGLEYKVCNTEGECWYHSDLRFKRGQKIEPSIFIETSKDGHYDAGNIVDGNGNILGTYERLSIDNDYQFVYSTSEQTKRKKETVIAAGTIGVAVGVCIGTSGVACVLAKEVAQEVVSNLLGLPLDLPTLRRTSKKGRKTKGKTELYERKGGWDKANKEFDSLQPTNVKTISTQYGQGKTGKLPDGSTITVRPGSSDGRPTLEIRKPNGRGDEYRYDP